MILIDVRDLIEAIILGLVQGVTEFIPVSSEAHLIITNDLLGFRMGGLVFDVLLHLGTLAALLIYFRKDLASFVKAVVDKTQDPKLVIYILIATLPGVVIGFFAYDIVNSALRSLWVVVVMLLLVSIFMFIADKNQDNRDLTDLNMKDALLIGFAQALALIPGTSRSGSTIVAGSLLGFNNAEAARFSFYMAIPILAGANVRVLIEPGVLQQIANQWFAYLVGVFVAFIAGYIVITWLLRYLSKHKLAVFAWYRIALAGLLTVVLIT